MNDSTGNTGPNDGLGSEGVTGSSGRTELPFIPSRLERTMRRTRSQYFDNLPLHRRKMNFAEALAMVKRQIKRKAIADGLIVDPSTRPPRCKFAWEFNGNENPTGGIVAADTRSEARHLIKLKLGLKKKDRLPIGITIIKVEGSAS